jgi:drug/metabolite transporter (DMT)-like permease
MVADGRRGSLAQNLYISGMKLTSATFASATTNLVPGVTFVLALIFRYERLAIRASSGQAKVAGTLLGVAGAMLLTFYKGADITPWHSHVNLVASSAAAAAAAHHQQAADANRVMGSLLCISSCVFYALWLILQAKLSKDYPFHYSSTALMCVMSTLQSVAFALWTDRDVAQWRLGLDVRLLSVAYSGVLASGVMLVVLSWCVKKRGPLFASVFNPLMLLVVAVLSSLLLGEKLYLGSALGAVLIVVGLYAVLWGKGREADNDVTTKVSELPLPIVTTDDDDDDDGTRGATVDVVVVQQAKTSDHDSSKQQQQRTTTTTR